MLKRMFLGLYIYIYMYSTYVSNGRFLNFRYVSFQRWWFQCIFSINSEEEPGRFRRMNDISPLIGTHGFTHYKDSYHTPYTMSPHHGTYE